nr:hypothetical protein [Photobacterium leiognathi]
MLLFAVLTAASSMLIHKAEQSISPETLAFFTFSLCTIIYTILNKFSAFSDFNRIKNNILNLAGTNITTAVCWLCTFISLSYISPINFLLAYLGTMPIGGLIVKRDFSIGKIISSLAIIFGVLLTVINDIENVENTLGVAIASFAGMVGAVYSRYSQALTKSFRDDEILSSRFVLINIITAIWFIFSGNETSAPSSDFLLMFLLVTLVSVVIPLYLFQRGISGLPIVTALSYTPLAPVICLIYLTISGGY